MDAKSKTEEVARSLNDIIEGLERDSFIGRNKEIDVFNEYLALSDQYLKILHIYGSGGTGKSFLLGEFNRIAEGNGMLFLKMDTGDYLQTPASFLEQLMALLYTKVNDINLEFDMPKHGLYQYIMNVLNDLANKHKIIIAIDTYSTLDGLDRWFRQVFVRHLHPNILVVLAGRNALKGEWEQSPAWRKVTKQIKLNNFSLEQTRLFLNTSGIEEEEAIRVLWRITDGHPLALTLATLTNQDIDLSNPKLLAERTPDILRKLTKTWLRDIKDEESLEIIELAALFNIFDQSSLSVILNKEVSFERFNELISLSFIKRIGKGWTMHNLVRDAITIELQHRNPEYYRQLMDQLTTYYYKKTIATKSAYSISQFFYYIGDEAIQSTFFQEKIDTSMYLEPVEEYNFQDVAKFFKEKRENITESNVQFFDRTTDKSILFYVPEKHNLIESKIIDEKYILKMGYNCAKLLRNKHGETIGLSVVVPINRMTVKHLLNEPVSRAFFSSLSAEELASFNVPETEQAGYFIRLLDYKDQADTKARSFLLYNLFSLLLSGGRIIVSTPLTFFQDMLSRFGFKVVPCAEHYDYGKDSPSPTYLLDVSGSNLASYLQHFMESISQNNKMDFISDTFSFTDREKEIVILILEDKPNATIAEQLFIAEVTVKKHITRILKKTNVTNRAQLIKRIMELI